MNKIDEIISRWNEGERTRIYCLLLFNYYLHCYYRLMTEQLPDVKNYSLSGKAVTNFFFVCLNSVGEDYGLFEMFRRFRIVCGWNQRIVSVSQPDIERLCFMMPDYGTNGLKWEKRLPEKRPKPWKDIGEDQLSELLQSSSAGRYTRMIDLGITEVLARLPHECLADRQPQRQEQSAWKEWLSPTSEYRLTHRLSGGICRHSYDMKTRFSLEELTADKQLMQKSLSDKQGP